MPQSYLLWSPAILLLVAYLAGFTKLIAELDEGARARFNEGGHPIWNVVGTGVAFALLLTPRMEIRIAAIFVTIVAVALMARLHHRRLRDAGFSEAFVKRLRRLTFLSLPATILFMLAIALRWSGMRGT
jgi:uncharacterized membrane protein YhaH (DUF805 family)